MCSYLELAGSGIRTLYNPTILSTTSEVLLSKAFNPQLSQRSCSVADSRRLNCSDQNLKLDPAEKADCHWEINRRERFSLPECCHYNLKRTSVGDVGGGLSDPRPCVDSSFLEIPIHINTEHNTSAG